jgi:hypothetical protein
MRDPIGKYRIVEDSLSSRTISIASEETKYTLDEIYNSSEDIRVQYSEDFKQAYMKLHYYDAVTALYQKDKSQALKDLRPIIGSKLEYFILYILILSPISIRTILKVLRR